MLQLSDSVRYLKGVGEKKAQQYEKLGVESIYSLLHFYPRDYLDYSDPVPLSEVRLGEVNCVRVTIFKKAAPQRIRKGMTLFRAYATDGLKDLTITIYNSKYLFDAFQEGQVYYLHGKVEGNLLRLEMKSPHAIDPTAGFLVQPIYPLTEGLGNKQVMSHVQQALTVWGNQLVDPLPDWVRRQRELCYYQFAYQNIHLPQDVHSLQVAKKRLVFDELLTLQLGLSLMKKKVRESTAIQLGKVDYTPFHQALPFTLTEEQQTVIDQCTAELQGTVPMNRLVQGDVGSGKTMVACALAYALAQYDYQTAVMAPTELLAVQHEQVFKKTLQPLGISVVLLTGSLTATEKKRVKQRIESGEAMVVIGTHALIQDSVTFARLGLVVTDEQHRFGVRQRGALAGKGENPHKLVMSATPIPRTLALMIYGDLDISIIQFPPRGRLPIQTFFVHGDKRQRAHQFIYDHIQAGEQAYIVCPFIEPTDGVEEQSIHSVTTYAEELQKGVLGGVKVGILHGKQKTAEKERVMREFKEGTIELLLATTVVEVGVDVPTATVMMIENAEQFGLAQLHQLRGRVGRGSAQSYCILVSDHRGVQTRQRIKTMTQSADGFYIAEQDLKLRGPGDFFGKKQHGLPALKIADMVDDMQVLLDCQEVAKEILEKDKNLSLPEHRGLRQMVKVLFEQKKNGD